MWEGCVTAGGRPLRHSDKGVFHVFMTLGMLFQCYSAGTNSTTGTFYVPGVFFFPVWAMYSLLLERYLKQVFHIPKFGHYSVASKLRVIDKVGSSH